MRYTSTSWSAIDWTEGKGWRTEDSSYESLTQLLMAEDQEVGICRIDDEVCVNDDRLLEDEIVDIDRGADNTGLGEIANVEGGKQDAVKKDEKARDVGVITEVEPRDESGKVGGKLRLAVFSSEESSPSSGEGKKLSAYGRNSGT